MKLMTEDISYFRKRFLGGFNREDVIKYIKKLAQERNELREAKEAADEEARAISREVSPLREGIEEVRREAQLVIDEKDIVMQALADEVTSLRHELNAEKRAGDEYREVNEQTEQEKQNLAGIIEKMRDELQAEKIDAEEGRSFKAELIEARIRIETLNGELEEARRDIDSLGCELEEARRDVEDGLRYRADAEARIASFEAVKQTLVDIGSALDSLRSSFDQESEIEETEYHEPEPEETEYHEPEPEETEYHEPEPEETVYREPEPEETEYHEPEPEEIVYREPEPEERIGQDIVDTWEEF